MPCLPQRSLHDTPGRIEGIARLVGAEHRAQTIVSKLRSAIIAPPGPRAISESPPLSPDIFDIFDKNMLIPGPAQ